MADAIREQIMAALATLVDASVPDGWTTERNPERAIDEQTLPFAAVLDGPHREIERATQLRAYEMNATIELAARAPDAAQTLTAGYAAIAAAIHDAVVAETGIGALTIRVDESGLGEIARLDDDGREFALVAPLELTIEFWTQQDDPTALAP